MLYGGEERPTGVADTEPVDVLHEPAVEREDEAVRAVGATPVVALAEVYGQIGDELESEARRERRDDARITLLARRRCRDTKGSVWVRMYVAHFGAKTHRAAAGFDARRKRVVDLLEAATHIAERLGAAVDARPKPGHRDLVREAAKFAAKQRLEGDAIGVVAHPVREPAGGGRVLQ